MKRAFLVDRQLLLGHAPKNLRRRTDVDDRLGHVLLQRIQYAHRALNVRVHRVEWRIEARARKALCGEVEDIVRLCLRHDSLNGQRIAQIAVEQRNPVAGVDPARDVRKVVQRAAPPAHPCNLPIRVFEQIFGQVGPHHACNARYQCSFGCHRLPGAPLRRLDEPSPNRGETSLGRRQLLPRQSGRLGRPRRVRLAAIPLHGPAEALGQTNLSLESQKPTGG